MLPTHKFVSYFLRSEGFPEVNARFFHPFNDWLIGSYYTWKGLDYKAIKTYCTDTLWQLEGVISMYLKLKSLINKEAKLEVEYIFTNKETAEKAKQLLDLYEIKDFSFNESLSFDNQQFKDFYFILKGNDSTLIKGGKTVNNEFFFDLDSTNIPYLFKESDLLDWVENLFSQRYKPVCFVFVEELNKEIINQVQNIRKQGFPVHLIPTNLIEVFNEFSSCYTMSLVLYIDKSNNTKRGYNEEFYREINKLEEYKISSSKSVDFFNTNQVLDVFNNPENNFIFNPSRIFALGLIN